VEAVGAVRFRDCISLADANYGGIRRCDPNFPGKLCFAFGSTARFFARPASPLGTFVYRLKKTPARPLLRVPTGTRLQQPSFCEE